MSKLFLLIVIFKLFHCEVFNNRPKIKVLSGDLIFESAYDRSIYLNPNGPKSRIYYGELNLQNVYNVSNIGPPNILNDNILNDKVQLNEVLRRIKRLESLTNSFSSNSNLNISHLTRKLNNLSNRIRVIQTLLTTRKSDECKSHLCENGGTCLNLVDEYHCLCPSNWKGLNCDEDVNECRNFAGTDLGCQNGAMCINRPGSYECICKPGWYGLHCTRTVKNCSGGDLETCGHGICVPINSGEGVKCICDQGWKTDGTGVACLTDINECVLGQGSHCSVNPKVDCINLPGSFRCGECPQGYEGDGFVCYDIDECVTVPNGGCSTSPMVSCFNTIGSRICGSCPPDYQGDGTTCTWVGACAVNRGGCHPSAQCIENLALGHSAQCLCPNGMEGDGIGLHGCFVSSRGNNTQLCENNPCGVHGHCHSLRQSYTCICYPGYGGAHCTDHNNICSNNPCHNGGSCRIDDRSERGFVCECTALHSGDVCQVHSCGGFLDSEEGSIIYPVSNTTYRHNSQCAWVVHTASDKVINVTFSKFNLEIDTSECRYDFLQIHDGRNSARQLIGRFCGNNFPNGGNIISSHNYLYFWFRSDHSIAKEGFALHWDSILPVCGGEINATIHGHINSPGSPSTYPANRDCYWHLKTTLGKRIQLHFFQLDIEKHNNCSFDYLAIYDGEHTTDPLLNRYCSSIQPAPIQSSGSEILIHFHSDASGFGKGFQITFAPVEGVPGCGGFFTSDRGEIVSPSYNGLYLDNLLCEYKITTRPDNKIHITFESFNLEKSLSCNYDFLKIYDGPSSDSPLVGKFCGSTHPKWYISSTNNLFIFFKSDHSLAAGGFKIRFKSVCLRTIVGDTGVVKSPNYPMFYPKYTECEYIINTTPGKIIQLAFQDIDIEDSRVYNCTNDYVEIRDGHFINSTLLGKYCGNSEDIPPTQISSHNYMYIKFNSDKSITGRGFYANYTTIDVECGGIYKEDSGLINHPSDNSLQYSNNQNCTWYIIAPEGMHIKFTWNRFDLESMRSCDSDYVEIIEIDDYNENNALGKYCGDSLPPILTTSSNRLMIRFISDFSIRESGFSLSYSFLDESKHCGGLFAKSHGFILSPNWPQTYEPNRDCTWIISIPIGRQITLNITDFDLEQPLHDKCDLGDYLIIRDGSTQTSPLIGIYCGSFKSKRIVSMTNSLYLHFHSDFYLSGSGFKIEWNGALTGCGGTLTSVSGSISSPNYPQKYNENAECLYRIVTSRGSRIRISFIELDLEKTKNCRDDYVEIFDGPDEHSSSYGKRCFFSPNMSSIETTSNFAFIKFRSDIFISAKGFLLQYNTICNRNIDKSYGAIESPGYPDKYPLNLNCLWTITVPKGNKINVTFTHFDLFSSFHHYRVSYQSSNRLSFMTSTPYGNVNEHYGNCEKDYLQIKETSNKNFSDRLCGNTLPKSITSLSNSLQIKFVSGSYFPRAGFRLEWVNYGCGGRIEKSEGSLSMNRFSSHIGEMECEWIIETPVGTAVSITFSEFYMTESKNCTVDAIELYNGQSKAYPLLTKICLIGQTTVQASSNFLFIRLVKQSSLRDVYFKSTFNSQRKGCGGVIESQSGSIHSTNYPKNYDNNIDCFWYIKVPKNHKIELKFTDFDLYSNPTDDDKKDCDDLVKIYEDYDISTSNYTCLICPNSNTSRFISDHSSIVVQFKTNAYGTAKGFKANFNMICGAIIEANFDGIISNDKFLSYTNLNCTWTVFARDLSTKIKLTIRYMSLPKNPDIVTNRKCPSSYLRVFDGSNDMSPQIGEFCGNKVPPTIVSRGNTLTIQFGSYTNTINGHFSAHYSTLMNACGGELISEEGSIASPNYPMSYPNNANCEWVLSTSPGNRVYITFESFDLYYSDGCNEDYLEVRENNGGGELLAVYCGQEVPTNTTTGKKLFIKFHSNNRNTGLGFLLHYGFLHGNDIIGLHSGEITSPLYPLPYLGYGDYSWRIIIDGTNTISININHLEIHKNQDTCNSKLLIYDGYDEDAPLLDELCGLLRKESKFMKSSSNVAFVKFILDNTNIGSIFRILWGETDQNLVGEPNRQNNCGTNKTEFLSIGNSFLLNSPNYPNKYEPKLNCVWIFQAAAGHHVRLIFDEISLEETPNCFADDISIYSSNNLASWTPLIEKICLSEKEKEIFDSANYMKVTFKTDSSISRKGFQARVTSACGGLLQDKSGVVELSQLDYSPLLAYSKLRCNWTVKVRPGRNIKIKFEHFNITNNNDCFMYVLIRNGESTESPFLGNGKYCGYSQENMHEMVSSSNIISVNYVNSMMANNAPSNFQNFKLRYEEKNVECGFTSTLDVDHTWEVINSPNYPSVPTPYTECVWIFRGPPGEIIRIDFLDRFDLDSSDECSSESVEIRDGSSRLSPLKGRLCKERPRPGTLKTSGNTMFIKYSTQLAEPRDGFKANVSIYLCGGTIISKSGELSAPGYPHMVVLPAGIVCQWEIISLPEHVIQLHFMDIDLPDSKIPCQTKVTIEEKVPGNNTVVETQLKLFCKDDFDESAMAIETLTNNVIIKLNYGEPNEWTHISESRGFRLTFNSSRPVCGGIVTAAEGYLTSPGYPMETSLQFCEWKIITPNLSRRVRLEIIDLNENQNMIAFNDLSFISMIEPTNEKNFSQSVFESSQNKITFYVWLLPRGKSTHRFKAKFSSDEPALCGGNLQGMQGELMSPNLQKSYFCEWLYTHVSDTLNDGNTYNTLYLVINVSSSSGSNCRFLHSKLTITSDIGIPGISFSDNVCAKEETTYRIPASTMHLAAIQIRQKPITFDLNWKLQPCGGIIHVGQESKNIINIPDSHNEAIDCAWVLIVSEGFRTEFKLEGTFNLDCSDEFIEIKSGLMDTSSIGEYCKNNIPEYALVSSFMYPYVQYHSKSQNKTNIKLLTKIVSHQCGRLLTQNDRMFTSPNFPGDYESNQECIWEIKAEIGFRVSLRFVDKFVVEDRVNCTKDLVLVYDWKESKYEEMARLCGRRLPSVYNSTFNQMKVILRTDADINLDGFKAQWNPICGGTFSVKSKEQYLYSPGYTNDYYPSLECNYKIVGPSNRILIKFLDFELEGIYPECKYDNVTIIEHSDFTHSYGLYCGNEMPLPFQAFEMVEITFKTDKLTQRKGFKLSYSLYSCGGQITYPTLVKSHESGIEENSYVENTNCTWFIEAPINKVVIIKFPYIDLENSYDCYSDYVAVYEGPAIDSSKRLSLMCGHINSTTVIKSNSNKTILQFVSDGSLNFKGFEAKITFSYSKSVGCGGDVELKSSSIYNLRSPLIGNNVVYENYLDCHWIVRAETDHVIKVDFTSFHVVSCNVNQTSIGFNKCDCDLVELKDGLNPNNLIIGTYCGHSFPPQTFSSSNLMSIRFSTDGEATSSGFEATLTSLPSSCGQSIFTVSRTMQRIRSPAYDIGSIPRGLHCSYVIESEAEPYSTIHLRVHVLDLDAGTDNNTCNRDRLIITSNTQPRNRTIGEKLILNEADDILFRAYYFDNAVRLPKHIVLCGSKKSLDFYVSKSVMINLQTTSEHAVKYRGVEIEFVYLGFCGKNYSELQGRIQSSYDLNLDAIEKDCYTLIAVPENYTISVYFISISSVYWTESGYLKIFDGNNTNAPLLAEVSTEYPDYLQLFSTGNFLLLHNRLKKSEMVTFDLNYVATNKGMGCGGKLQNEIGRVTSPLYPRVYRKKSTCEWELETPTNTRLLLRFLTFDLGNICDQNYLTLVDKNGNTISTYCSETPADYTSDDNYVKIVFTTTRNNGGTGWVADFCGIL